MGYRLMSHSKESKKVGSIPVEYGRWLDLLFTLQVFPQ